MSIADHPITRSPIPMSFFTHLECSVPCGAPKLDARLRQHLCACGAPLFARYALEKARAWAQSSRSSLTGREPNMWRNRAPMPLFAGPATVTLAEGCTPLVRAHTVG